MKKLSVLVLLSLLPVVAVAGPKQMCFDLDIAETNLRILLERPAMPPNFQPEMLSDKAKLVAMKRLFNIELRSPGFFAQAPEVCGAPEIRELIEDFKAKWDFRF